MLVVACKKPPPAVVDAGPPPVVEVDAAPVNLAPLDEDAGVDAADANDGAAPKKTGSGLNTNQSRAKQCCSAIRAQAKQLGASPEANMLLGIATTCDQLAVQVGPTSGGQAPELAPLRQMLKGKTMPAVCQGL
jgi:hypothetical protein